MIALLDLFSRLGWWYGATAGLLALEAYGYWRTMRGWPPEARIFAFGLGCASVLLMATGWARGAAGTWTPAEGVAFQFGFFVAGGFGTAPVFAHCTWQDRSPVWAIRRRQGRLRERG